MQPIGERIREFRNRLGLTQDQLAARMQARGHDTIIRQRIVMIEGGTRAVTSDELVSFARVLGIPITILLGVPDNE